MKLSLEQGTAIVRYARSVISSSFGHAEADVPENLKNIFTEKRGTFVTLEKHPSGRLRGCIGIPEPVMPLGKAVKDAALSAAWGDPRFNRLDERELEGITVEVSILTKPAVIEVDEPSQYVDNVKIGRDGLIVDNGFLNGLLLPQVPVEQGWDVEEFLSQTCVKAGLSPDSWLAGKVKIFSFSAQVFSEQAPNADIVEKKLSK